MCFCRFLHLLLTNSFKPCVVYSIGISSFSDIVSVCIESTFLHFISHIKRIQFWCVSLLSSCPNFFIDLFVLALIRTITALSLVQTPVLTLILRIKREINRHMPTGSACHVLTLNLIFVQEPYFLPLLSSGSIIIFKVFFQV